MRRDFQRLTKNCVTCQKSKISVHVKAPLQHLETPSERFGFLHVDLVGPLPESNGKNMLFTVIDNYSGFVAAYPLESQPQGSNSVACAKHLIDWIALFGVPHTVVSDRGPQFASAIWKELSKILNFKVNVTTAYHPQANGKIERFHRTLKSALRSRLEGRSNWEMELPWALLGIRNQPNTDSGFAPSDYVFGSKVRFPGQPSFPISYQAPSTFVERLRNAVTNQVVKKPEWHLAGNLKFDIPNDLKTCKQVLIREERKLASLRQKYSGPFEVISRNDKAFKIKFPSGEDFVSINRLKPFHQ
ncbi:Transposon Ty3-G Gag-Pol poly [Paramuricea clavata]|uniref:Transposon Ty3-G Gag-Pol poly n=1 Tax=Paramuricea clavata TaxID=317549 RepID=A0A7D9KM61_PARCT|nr:Transposon Ty3-G Gag-Pol poly [Paramuricea clavata]